MPAFRDLILCVLIPVALVFMLQEHPRVFTRVLDMVPTGVPRLNSP